MRFQSRLSTVALLAFLLVFALAIAGCTSGEAEPTAQPTEEPEAEPPEPTVEAEQPTAQPEEPPTPVAEAGECPATTDETWLLNNAQQGYCLLYPIEYKVGTDNPASINLVIGSLLNTVDPRVSIDVVPANGRTAVTAADDLLAEFPADLLTNVERSTATIGGVEAQVVDGLPGQDINRRVLIVKDDLLYQLFFSPVATGDAEHEARMDALYTLILDSFTFVPRSDEVGEICLEPKADMQLVTMEEQGYCLLLPANYESSETSEAETVYYVGSLLDVEHPKLFIEVLDAAGRTATEVADELAASFPADFGIERTFGATLGFETAEQLDNVPGQDIGRVLVVAHDGRMYKLTFVPAGPDAGAVYEETLALYDLVNNSFRFIPATGEAVTATATPPAEEEEPAGGDVLCSSVPRPALGLFVPGKDYLIVEPLSEAGCFTILPGDPLGAFQDAAGAVYYTRYQDDQYVVNRLTGDGALTSLDFTAVPAEDALMNYGFVVSDDGSQLAWAATGETVGRMWTAAGDGSDMVAPLPDFQVTPENRRAVVPVRFSADNSTLFYTLQPVGVGGTWIAFNGRYDNLYALRLRTQAEPELIFDCAELGALLCIGDFMELDGSVSVLAYTNGAEVVVLNGQGETLNSITLEHDYVGYPTFGPAGDLVFYGADLAADTGGPPMPEMGYLYRVAPPTAPHEVLAGDAGLLYPAAWLDDTHVVVNYVSGENWGVALVGLDGLLDVLESEPAALFVDVLRE